MIELIKVADYNGQKVVSARELHQFLEVSSIFVNWINRMLTYGFIANVDYQLLDQNTVNDSGEGFFPKMEKTSGGRPSIDYALTMDCAKGIAMIQRSDKGKEARDYFIACEKRLQQLTNPQTEEDYVAAAWMIINKRLETAKQILAKQAPLAAYTTQVLKSDNLISISVIAKDLGMTARALNDKLFELGIQFKKNGIWLLYAKYQGRGYTKTKTHSWEDSEGKIHNSITTYWTERGRGFINYTLGVLNPAIEAQLEQVNNPIPNQLHS